MNIHRRTILLVVSTVILLVMPGMVSAASIVKIGVIDLQKALNATSEGMAAKASLKQKHEVKQGKLDKMQSELETMEEKLKSPVLSEDAVKELKESYRGKKKEIIDFLSASKRQEERENQALSSRILSGLVKIAREIGEKEGYTVILEKSSSGVIFSLQTLDLTERVVKIYNENYQAGGAN
ncbi:MAG: OmpH family outer membrane protein [bacterium]